MSWNEISAAVTMRASARTALAADEIRRHEDDSRLVNELFGFVHRCAAEAVLYNTDLNVSLSMATYIAGPLRVDRLLAAACDAGLMLKVNPLPEQVTYAINRKLIGPL